MTRSNHFINDRPLKPRYTLPLVLGIVGVLFLTGCGGGERLDPSTASVTTPATTTTSTPTSTTKPNPTQPVNTTTSTDSATLTAATLAKKFLTYSGKAVTVEGVVESAVEVSRGTNVLLDTSPGFPRVRLLFPKGRWTGEKPTAGAIVSAKGTVTKAVTATFVDVSDCTLVTHTPAKPDEGIAVTAEEITTAFDKDAKAAEAEYRDKTLRVTGKVLRVSDAGGTAGAVVFLKGATPTDKKKNSLRVSAVFTGAAKDETLKLKSGDTVTITGRMHSFNVEIVNNDWTLLLDRPKLVK